MGEAFNPAKKVFPYFPDNEAVLAVLKDPEAGPFLAGGAEIACGEGFSVCRHIFPVLLYRKDAHGGISGKALFFFLKKHLLMNAVRPEPYSVDYPIHIDTPFRASSAERHVAAILYRSPLILGILDSFFALD